MTPRKYARYRDSGVEWLKHVPEHWTLRRLGYYFEERREKVSDADFAALSVTKNGIVPQLETAAKTDDGDNRKRVAVGDFVINSRSDRKGSSGVSDLDGSVSLINTVLIPRDEVHRRFVHHLLRSAVFQEEYYRFGRGIVADLWSTNYAEMRNILLAVPPIYEQVAIADYLDSETVKIDALVEEQLSLIELLKEKRQAVIARAVTKGLDPKAPMRDSGIEWIGQVPEHWSVTRLGYFATVENGTTPGRDTPAYWADGDVPWLSSGEVNKLYVDASEEFITQAALQQCSLRLLPAGTVIVGLIGQGKTRGMSALLQIDATINQNLAAICPGPKAVSAYFLHLFHAMYEWLREAGRGGNQAAMNCEMLRSLRIPVPPVVEQTEIAAFVDSQLVELDALRAEAELAMRFLGERRSALISAAVTGKIDVRDPVPQPVAVAA